MGTNKLKPEQVDQEYNESIIKGITGNGTLTPDKTIAALKTDIETEKKGIVCQGTLSNYTSSWVGTHWVTWHTNVNRTGFSDKGNVQRIYPPKTGWYYVKAQQLVQLNGGTMYYEAQKNAVTVMRAYTNSIYHTDMHVSCMMYMTPDDYFSIYAQISVGAFLWGGTHSSFSIFYIGEY